MFSHINGKHQVQKARPFFQTYNFATIIPVGDIVDTAGKLFPPIAVWPLQTTMHCSYKTCCFLRAAATSFLDMKKPTF